MPKPAGSVQTFRYNTGLLVIDRQTDTGSSGQTGEWALGQASFMSSTIFNCAIDVSIYSTGWAKQRGHKLVATILSNLY